MEQEDLRERVGEVECREEWQEERRGEFSGGMLVIVSTLGTKNSHIVPTANPAGDERVDIGC